MSSENSSSTGIGFAGLLTLVFIFLKLNPGGNFTTVIAEWPWFEWWGWSVFCPMIFSFYAGMALVATFALGFIAVAVFKR